jgi:glutamate racemase
MVPPAMAIVDSAESTARVVKRMIKDELADRPKQAATTATGSLGSHRTFRFYVTDSVDKFRRLATRFLGRQVDNVEQVDLETRC